MTDTPQPPEPQKHAAGWYPNPDNNGGERYYDGNGWTEQTRGGGPAAPTAPAAAATGNPKADAKAAKAYAKATRPWYKKKRFIIPLAIVVIAIAASASGGGGDDGPEKVSGANDSSASDDKKSDDKGDKAGSKGNPIKVGETVKLEGTKYTVTKVKTAGEVGGEFLQEKANGVYVIVNITIENTKDETKTFSDSAANLFAGNDKKYSSDTDAIFAVDPEGDTLIFAEMQPDVPLDGTLVFDIPKDQTAGSLLEVSDLFGRGEAYIDLGLK